MFHVRTTALRVSAAATVAVLVLGSLALRAPAAPAAAQTDPNCGGVITGTVRTAALLGATAGRPVAGARVMLLSATASGNPAARLGVEVETDADGRYRHANVCDGTYIVRASVQTSTGTLAGIYDPNGDGVADALTLVDAHRAFGTIDIVLAPALSPQVPPRATAPPPPTAVPCAFTDGAVAGTVFGPNGQPYAGASVSVRALGGRIASTAIGHGAMTADDGMYRVEGLCEGDYQVAAYARTNAGGLAGSYDADGDGQPDTVALVEAARSAAGIDIHLAAVQNPAPGATAVPPRNPAPAPTAGPPPTGAQGGAITGVVHAADGSPVVGARVLAMSQGAGNPSVAMTVVALTDATGAYRVGPLGWGAYVVVAIDVDAAGVNTGSYDPDADGLPNPVDIGARRPVATGIDIVMPARLTGAGRPRIKLPIESPPSR
ncbi:MAG: carboxypeptidase-like regulatory domain-containing protein [Ardenticatenales bacterium]